MINKISKKLIFLIVAIFIAALFIPSPLNRVKLSGIKEYVIKNNEYLNEVAQQLLQVQDAGTPVSLYRHRVEIPKGAKVNKIYRDLWVDYIYVEKDHLDEEDEVEIVLKERNGNYICSIRYSPDNEFLDCFNKPIEGDKFEYDGESTQERFKYKAEKICDHWSYVEEDRW